MSLPLNVERIWILSNFLGGCAVVDIERGQALPDCNLITLSCVDED
jgi:hypothetical protein